MSVVVDLEWPLKIEKHAKRIFSQGNQDGVLQYIFQNIGTTNKSCVEFGFNSATLTGGSGPNVGNLVKNMGWNCLLLDGNYENKAINLHKAFLTSENLCDILASHNVPLEPDYVSIDVDSCDLWLFQALLTNYRPRVVSVEYNSHFPIGHAITFPNDPSLLYGKDRVYGASLNALNMVATENKYKLVHVEKYLDAFFVREDLLTNCKCPPFQLFAKYTQLCAHPACKTGKDQRMIDYSVWTKTKDIKLAQKAASAVAKKYLAS